MRHTPSWGGSQSCQSFQRGGAARVKPKGWWRRRGFSYLAGLPVPTLRALLGLYSPVTVCVQEEPSLCESGICRRRQLSRVLGVETGEKEGWSPIEIQPRRIERWLLRRVFAIIEYRIS